MELSQSDKLELEKQGEQSRFSVKGDVRSKEEVSARREYILKIINNKNTKPEMIIPLNSVLHELDWMLYERENPTKWG